MSSQDVPSAHIASRGRSLRWKFGLLFFGVICVWFAYLLLALSTTSQALAPDFLRLPSSDANTTTILALRGQLGDAFGVFNALVSALALVGLFLTLRTQQIQVESQQAQSDAGDLLLKQQQFQEQLYRAIDAYRSLLSEVTVRDFSDDGPEVSRRSGREALNWLWGRGLIARLPAEDSDEFLTARERQLEASATEFFVNLKSRSEAADAIKTLLAKVRTNPELSREILSGIGDAWASIYQANQFQLDALFRAWYTVYRVLETAPSYRIAPPQIKLYAAMFRAQLSWIEMAFLLINQSALPDEPLFPRACHYSNEYAVFDNLAEGQDLVVAILKLQAQSGVPRTDRDQATLTASAFGESGKSASPPTSMAA